MTITDQLAERLGIDKQPIKRARAGVKHALEELCGNGHCAVYTEDLIKQSIELLEISQDLIQEDIYQGLKEEDLIEDIIGNKPVIYIDKLYYAEIGVARQIHRLNQSKSTWGHLARNYTCTHAVLTQGQLNLTVSANLLASKPPIQRISLAPVVAYNNCHIY